MLDEPTIPCRRSNPDDLQAREEEEEEEEKE